MSESCSTHGGDKKCMQTLATKSEGKGLLVRPRRIWEDNIRLDLRETGWDDVDWIHLARDRSQWQAVMNTVMNLRFP
jgi:hypothetical protein